MKNALIITLLSLFFVSCDNDYKKKITRTADTQLSMTLSDSIPLYRRDCEMERVYGPDMSCGSYNTYNRGYNCTYDQFGRRYCRDNYNSFPEYRSCYHYEQVCHKTFVRNFTASIILNFDEAAILTGDQKEKYTLKGSYKDGEVKGRLKIKSKHYEYEEMDEVYIHDGETKVINIRSLGAK